MAFINEALVFADPAAITGMTAGQLVDGMFYACSDTGDGWPGWYQYKAASSATIDSPNVIDVTNGTGRFILFGGQSSGGGGGGGNVEVILSSTDLDPLVTPTNDGTSGISFYLAIGVPDGYSGTEPPTLYFGVDPTGSEENNGWVRLQNW